MSQSVPRKILVVKNRAMGDSLMGLATVSYIRSLYPDAHIAYGLPSWITALYADAQTDADEIVPLDFKSAADWLAMWKFMKDEQFDVVFEMFQSGRSAKFFKLYSLLNKTKYYFHNHHEKGPGFVHDQGNVFKPTIQRDLDGAWSYFGRDQDLPIPSYLEFAPSLYISDDERENTIVFGVVATRETKKWELKNYYELAKLILNNDPECTIIIPLSNSEDDQKTEQKLKAMGLPNHVQILKATLEELPGHIARSKLYIGNDTGLKHLAAALGVKTYTLFGPEPPTEWHPYDESIHPYFYKYGLECRTRTAHYCGLSTCDDMSCLKEFTAQSVYQTIQEDL